MMPLIFNSTIIVFFAVAAVCGSAAVYADKRRSKLADPKIGRGPLSEAEKRIVLFYSLWIVPIACAICGTWQFAWCAMNPQRVAPSSFGASDMLAGWLGIFLGVFGIVVSGIIAFPLAFYVDHARERMSRPYRLLGLVPFIAADIILLAALVIFILVACGKFPGQYFLAGKE
jgi:hypothetical protein